MNELAENAIVKTAPSKLAGWKFGDGHPAGNLPTEEKKVEYDELVEFYKKKLLERYMMCDPERRRLIELIRCADTETVGELLAIMERKEHREGA